MAIFGHVCTYGILYSVCQVAGQATERGLIKSQKGKKTEMTARSATLNYHTLARGQRCDNNIMTYLRILRQA